MDGLVELFEDLGYDEVDTYRASGNVSFEATADREALEAAIEEHLEEALDYDVPTFVRSAQELEAIIGRAAFSEEADQSKRKRYVVFLKQPLDESGVGKLADLQNDVDRFEADGSAIYWLRRMDAGESMATGGIEKQLGVVATRRTLNTVERMVI